MGIFIIIIVSIFEIVFMTYCIKTKDNQSQVRNWIRVASIVIFMGLTITPIINWSFRWYLLGVTLLVFFIIGVVRLFTNKFGKKPYKKLRIVSKGVAIMLLFIFVTMPAIIFPQYNDPITTGEYKIDQASYTFIDTNRIETFKNTGENRKLNVEFWYPEEAKGKYPLIVFSHGAFGVKMSNTSTFMELASNGYVVCSIDHPYHAAGTIDDNGKLTIGSNEFVQEVVAANKDVYSSKEQLEIYNKWMNLRTGDINFIIDTIFENTKNNNDEVYELIDTNKIGLIGHSLGGAASTQLGRERDDIGAVINLDGTMLGEYRANGDGEPIINGEPFHIPMLNFYSEYVINEIIEKPEYVYPNKYISSISPQAFEVCIKGSNHMSYTDLPLFSPFLAKKLSGISGGSTKASVDEYYCIETMNSLVLEFFNCYLKGEGTFATKEFY